MIFHGQLVIFLSDPNSKETWVITLQTCNIGGPGLAGFGFELQVLHYATPITLSCVETARSELALEQDAFLSDSETRKLPPNPDHMTGSRVRNAHMQTHKYTRVTQIEADTHVCTRCAQTKAAFMHVCIIVH